MREFELSTMSHYGHQLDCVKTVVPTYNGKSIDVVSGIEDFGEPKVPVLICPADGLHIVLGTHAYDDLAGDIQIERRHNGWLFLMTPPGLGDASGFVIFLDDGRSFVAPETAAGSYQIEVVDNETAVAELDNRPPDAMESENALREDCLPDAVLPTIIARPKAPDPQPKPTAKLPNSPDVIDALRSAYEALAGDSNDAEHDALWALVVSLEECDFIEWREYSTEWLIEDFRKWAGPVRSEYPDWQDIDTYVTESRPVDSNPFAVRDVLYEWANNSPD